MHRKKISVVIAMALSVASMTLPAVADETQILSEATNEASTETSTDSEETVTPTPTPEETVTPTPTPEETVTPTPAEPTPSTGDNSGTTGTADTSSTPANTNSTAADAAGGIESDQKTTDDTYNTDAVTPSVDTYTGIVYPGHAGAENALEKHQTVITAEEKPEAFKLTEALIAEGYTKEAACGITGALLTVNNGHDIGNAENFLKGMKYTLRKKWKASSEASTHLTNLGYGSSLITDVNGLKSASVQSAALSFLASYENYITAKNGIRLDYSTVNEFANVAAATCLTYANEVYRGFYGGETGEDTVYTSADVRTAYEKVEKVPLLIKSSSANIYEEKSETSRVISTPQKDTIFYLLEEDDTYYYVECGNTRGYLKKSDAYSKEQSARLVKKKGEENFTKAQAAIPMAQNAAADDVQKTVYLFGEATGANIADEAVAALTEETTNEGWISSVLTFFDMNATLTDSDMTDNGETKDASQLEAGDIVAYKEQVVVSDTKPAAKKTKAAAETDSAASNAEETKEVELYAVYLGDGTYCTVNEKGEAVSNLTLSADKIVSVTDMIEEEETVQVVTNHNVPYYCQGEFGGTAFGEGTVATHGCGITSFAMLASYATQSEITPKDAAAWAMANGADTSANWGAFSILAAHYGVGYVGQFVGPLYGGSAQSIAEYLQQGYLVIGSQTGGTFNPSGSGHYILYTGIDANGNIFVNDPSTLTTSQAGPYSQADAFGSCKQYWVFQVQ